MQANHSGEERQFAVEWEPPDQRMGRAWNNTDETTEFGASTIGIAAAEAMLGLYVVARGDVRIGADFYVDHDTNVADLETALRFEVSGVDHGDVSRVRARLREKVEQTRNGTEANRPAVACAVGFLVQLVLFETVEAS